MAPVGFFLVNDTQLLAFAASLSSITVMKEQSVLICSRVRMFILNQLRIEFGEEGGGRDRKREEKTCFSSRPSLLFIHTYGTH